VILPEKEMKGIHRRVCSIVSYALGGFTPAARIEPGRLPTIMAARSGGFNRFGFRVEEFRFPS